MTTFAVTSINSLLCQASTCFRIGSKLRCIRSTPTEMQSMSENDFECFASTGVNTPATILRIWAAAKANFLQGDFPVLIRSVPTWITVAVGRPSPIAPSSPAEFHPEALTDPCLTVSTHTAPATHPHLPPSARTLCSYCFHFAP